MSIASNLFFVNVLVKYILQVMDELSPMPVVRCSYVTMVGFTPLSVETEGMYSCTIRLGTVISTKFTVLHGTGTAVDLVTRGEFSANKFSPAVILHTTAVVQLYMY